MGNRGSAFPEDRVGRRDRLGVEEVAGSTGRRKRIKSLLSSISDYLNSAQVLSSLAERAFRKGGRGWKRTPAKGENRRGTRISTSRLFYLCRSVSSRRARRSLFSFSSLSRAASSSSAAFGGGRRSTIDERWLADLRAASLPPASLLLTLRATRNSRFPLYRGAFS